VPDNDLGKLKCSPFWRIVKIDNCLIIITGFCLQASDSSFKVYAFSTLHCAWIGAGTVYREEAGAMALLERGSFANFERFEDDARGLILVFTTGTILR